MKCEVICWLHGVLDLIQRGIDEWQWSRAGVCCNMCLVQTQAGEGSGGVTEEKSREWITTSSSASNLSHLGQITSTWSEILFSLIQT